MKAQEDSLKSRRDLDCNDNDYGDGYFANMDIASNGL